MDFSALELISALRATASLKIQTPFVAGHTFERVSLAFSTFSV
jgi:hypothetical protein